MNNGDCEIYHHDLCADQSRNAAAPLRLNKIIADSGYCSRRKADELIKAGLVTVNGVTCLDLATRCDGSAIIAINGKPIGNAQKHAYLLMNKPVQVVSTVKDPQGRQTVLDLLPESLRRLRLYPVGRLDYFSEGLLLLTNDGKLAHALMHPRFHMPKYYEVVIRGKIPAEVIDQFESGMTLPDGIKLKAVKTGLKSLPDGNTLLSLELRQGVNRQIRRMCACSGLTILRLIRTGEGPLRLGKLALGKVRALSEAEAARLYAALRQ